MVDYSHKIILPQRPTYLVPRPRLTDQLCTIYERRLVTLTAPAGYGKTSLLLDFAYTAATLPICWYTLDRFDEDPWVFLNYLSAAVAQRFPGTTDATTALLASRSQATFDTVVAALMRDIYAIGQEFILIIDDWHLVDHVPEIGDAVATLLMRCLNCRLILASRIYPAIPDMMLLAARRQVTGLNEEKLSFTAPEVVEVLSAEQHSEVSLDQAINLVEQSGGWITGILLSLQTTPTRAVGGRRAERPIYRFLAEQVFNQQPPEMQEFLLQSALLDELTAEHCDTILARNDSGDLLDQLLLQHVFITEIKPGILRYHPLFREFLHDRYRRTNAEGYRDTARRMARVYMDQGQWNQAFDTCVAVGDLETAQRVVAAGGEQAYTNGRLETLERWFAALPLDNLDAPLLCLNARVLLARGNHHEAQKLAELAERRVKFGEEPVLLLLQSQIARVAGNYDDALKSGQKAFELATDPALKAQALNMLGVCYQRIGDSAKAIEAMEEALVIERQRNDFYAVALLQHDLGVCHEAAGMLRIAEEYYSQADAYWSITHNLARRALSLNSKGVVQHLAGRYRQAHGTLTMALTYAYEASIAIYEALVQASLGDLYSDLQLFAQARSAYDNSGQTESNAYLMNYLELAVVRLLLRQRQYESAARRLKELPETTVSRYANTMLLLCGSLACGQGNRKQAQEHAHQAITALAQSPPSRDLALAYLLQAQVAALPPDDPPALVAALEQAAQVADQIGYDTFLIAETLHIPGLLRRAQAAGWARAVEWLQRQQDLLLAAQMIGQNDQRPVLAVRTLGSDQVLLNGQPVEIGWLRAREVLYYLLAHPQGATPDQLREAIWPDLSAERSKGALKTAIYQLREALPRDLIVLQGRQLYRLDNETVRVDYDVERFLSQIDTRAGDLEALQDAVALYNGHYLPLSDNPWSSALRSHLEQRYLEALRCIARQYEDQQAPAEALAFYRRILALDPLDEAAHAGIMRCHVILGNRAAAIEQYRTLRHDLDEALGLEPAPTSEAEQLYHQILNG